MDRIFRSGLFPLIVIVLLVYLAGEAKAKTPGSAGGSGVWWSLVTALVPFVLLVGVWILLQKRMRPRVEEDLTAQVRNRSTA